MIPIVSLAHVTYAYPGNHRVALRDLSVEVPAACVSALLGPNGSGKTTLLHLILGILAAQQGSVRLAGRPQASYSRRQLSQMVGLVPQDEHLTFEFTVLDYVLLGRAPYLRALETPGAVDHQTAWQALQTAGVSHLARRSLGSLSGGERQLVIVARALAQQPRILLLDEPTAHLDLANRARVLHLMRELAAQGVTVIFTSHDPTAAAAIADHVILLRQGETVAAGLSTEVLTSTALSDTYGIPVTVRYLDGKLVILSH